MRLILAFGLITSFAQAEGEFVVMPSVNVEASPDGGWHVTYELSEAVDHLTFYRPSTPRVQTDFWQIVSPGFVSLENDAEELVVRRADGQSFREVRYYIPNYRFFIEKDYFDAFSFADGGQLLYTGHLAAIGSIGTIESMYQTALVSGNWRMVARALPNENIVSTIGVFEEKAELFLGFDGGSYIYFGSSLPVENDFMRAVIDTRAPEWIVQPLQQMLPELATFFTDKFGKQLTFKPLTFVSTNLEDCEGKNSKAGVLPQVLQIDLSCSGWREPDLYLFWLLAHESVHFWNGGLFEKLDGDEHYWMSEGSASYLASKALLDLGYFDKNIFDQKLQQDFARCESYRAEHALSEAAEVGEFSAFYDCGSMLFALSDEYIQSVGRGETIYTAWHVLFERAMFHDNIYTPKMYFEVLSELGVDATRISLLKEIVE